MYGNARFSVVDEKLHSEPCKLADDAQTGMCIISSDRSPVGTNMERWMFMTIGYSIGHHLITTTHGVNGKHGTWSNVWRHNRLSFTVMYDRTILPGLQLVRYLNASTNQAASQMNESENNRSRWPGEYRTFRWWACRFQTCTKYSWQVLIRRF